MQAHASMLENSFAAGVKGAKAAEHLGRACMQRRPRLVPVPCADASAARLQLLWHNNLLTYSAPPAAHQPTHLMVLGQRRAGCCDERLQATWQRRLPLCRQLRQRPSVAQELPAGTQHETQC